MLGASTASAAIVGGIGTPELVIVLTSIVLPLLGIALLLLVLYFVVKRAVRDGIREAREDDINRRV